VGSVAGLLVGVVCFTGAVLVFRDQIDCWQHPYRKVEALGRPWKNLEELRAAVEADFPRNPPNGMLLYPGRQDRALLFYVPEQPFREVFVDPYTGQITGSRTSGAWGGWLRGLHVRLQLRWGRWLVGGLGVVLLVSLLSGALIYGRFLRGPRRMGLAWYQLRPGKLARRDLHRFIGVSSLAFNLLLAVTGVVLAFGWAREPVPLPGAARVADGKPIGVDAAIRAAGIGAVSVLFPSPRSWRYTVYAADGGFVTVAAGTGAVMQVAKGGFGWRAWHYGAFAEYGAFAKWGYFLFGLTPLALAVLGWLARMKNV
jgi:uncharacterized iron-regulated membrane protein